MSVAKELPILFSDEMVRAILDGRKTQTRRAVNPRDPSWVMTYLGDGRLWPHEYEKPRRTHARPITCPYGVPGDRLWVREAWGLTCHSDETEWHRTSIKRADDRILGHWCAQYRADWGTARENCFWRPSIHMPRWASRLSLEVVSVRVERLQDISEEDAMAEGCPLTGPSPFVRGYGAASASGWFSDLWERINGEGSWAKNPLVWVVDFRRAGASSVLRRFGECEVSRG